MTDACGYAGRILRVDLSSARVTHVPTRKYADRFLGGRGIGAGVYWEEVPENVNAFDAENRLIIATGPLAGFKRVAGSRTEICGKSPTTFPEMFCYSNFGGSWGAELKFAGYDGIIIKGQSEKPVYLFVQDGMCEIRDASTLWTKDAVQTRQMLKGELGQTVKVLAIGPAGKNRVPLATILAENDSTATSGFGAVFGSKRLKAIAVMGSGKVIAAKPEELQELTNHIGKLAKDTWKLPPSMFKPEKKRQLCYGCIAGCLRSLYKDRGGDEGESKCQASTFYRGAAMEYYKGPSDVPFQATRLCDKFGLDTKLIAPIIWWLFRCWQEGVLSDESTGMPISKFGSLEFIETVVKMISLRQGFGDILAQGITRAADHIGENAKALIGDLVFPKTGQLYTYDPRMYIAAGLFYAMEPRQPIQHLHEFGQLMLHWLEWHRGSEDTYVSTDLINAIGERFWGSKIAADFSTYKGKAMAAKRIQDRQYARECLVLCDFAGLTSHVHHAENHLGDPSLESKLVSAITGREMDEDKLNRLGERVFNLQRAILAREGHRGRKADSLPEFNYAIPLPSQQHNPECLLPGENGKIISRKGAVVDRQKFEEMKDEYYCLRGWDLASGLQTKAKLKQLELEDVAEDLVQRGLIV